MDTMWSFRWAYSQARKVQHAQDMYCAKAEAGLWSDIYNQEFPEDLKWEALVDVLRGRVRVRFNMKTILFKCMKVYENRFPTTAMRRWISMTLSE